MAGSKATMGADTTVAGSVLPSDATPAAPGAAAAGSSAAYARGDHVHPAQSVPTAPLPATQTPSALGTAAVGSSARYAREDHVHTAVMVPVAGSATPAPLGTAVPGVATAYSREDHVHAAPAATVTALANVTIAETAAIAINAGVRKVTVTAAGTVPGGNYLLFPTAATPAGYALADVVCVSAGQLQVSLTAPLLALGASYSITCRCVRVG